MRWDNPVDAYLSFKRAASEGKTKVAYDALSEPTRKKLELKANEVTRASDGGVKPAPADLFFAHPTLAEPVTEVALLKQEGNVAMLKVMVGSEARQLRMVKENEAWKVDLSEQLP